MIVYKYLSPEHLKDFKQRGSIHINTLHHLRSEYETIKDEFEGRHQLTFTSKERETTFTANQFRRLMPSLKVDFEKGENTTIVFSKGTTVSSNTDTSDAYVFCTSLINSRKLNSKFKHASFYKILNPQKFAEILFLKMSERCEMNCYKIGRVTYNDKHIVFNEKKRQDFLNYKKDDFWKICFTKPKRFSGEREFRMVFNPQFWRTSLNPLDIDCPQLLDYCSF